MCLPEKRMKTVKVFPDHYSVLCLSDTVFFPCLFKNIHYLFLKFYSIKGCNILDEIGYHFENLEIVTLRTNVWRSTY